MLDDLSTSARDHLARDHLARDDESRDDGDDMHPADRLAAYAQELSAELGAGHLVTWQYSAHVSGDKTTPILCLAVYWQLAAGKLEQLECVHEYSENVDGLISIFRKWLAVGKALPAVWFAGGGS